CLYVVYYTTSHTLSRLRQHRMVERPGRIARLRLVHHDPVEGDAGGERGQAHRAVGDRAGHSELQGVARLSLGRQVRLDLVAGPSVDEAHATPFLATADEEAAGTGQRDLDCGWRLVRLRIGNISERAEPLAPLEPPVAVFVVLRQRVKLVREDDSR